MASALPAVLCLLLEGLVILQEDEDKSCGHVYVLQTSVDDETDLRMLTCGQTFIGAAYVVKGVLADQIVYTGMAMQYAAYFAAAKPVVRALSLGVGAGSVGRALQSRHGVVVDGVELSDAVLRSAQAHFGLGPPGGSQGRLVQGDAVSMVRDGRASERYDLIVSDLWPGSALCDVDGLHHLEDNWLRKSTGILVINMVGFVHGTASYPVHTCVGRANAVFSHVRAFVDEHDGRGHLPTNVVIMASQTEIAFALPEALLREAALGGEAAVVARVLNDHQELPGNSSGQSCSDGSEEIGDGATAFSDELVRGMERLQAATHPPEAVDFLRKREPR